MAKAEKSKKKSEASLKSQNRLKLASVVATNFAVAATLIATGKLAFPSLNHGVQLVSSAAQAGLGAILAGILSDQFSPKAKARIVYWRWMHPLPGARAFSEIGPADDRVDMQALTEKYGALPNDSEGQNKVWYKIYKAHEGAISVVDANKQYLFCRDYSALALIFFFTLPTFAAFKVKPIGIVFLYWAILGFQYLLVRRAAVLNGRRLVANVLAEAA